MRIKKLVKALSAIGFGLALAGPASAAVTFFSPVTSFQDDNIDFVVDSGAGNIGTLGIGDRLISVLEFNDTQGIIAGQGPAFIAPTELAGVADVTIVAVLANGTLVLAPSGAAGVLSAFAPGTAVALWHDTSPDLNVINAACGTRANCMLLAGLGSPDPDSSIFLTAGFFGDLDASWVSSPENAGENISTVENGLAGTTFGSFNFNLQVGINNTGQTLAETRPCAPFCGIGGNGLIQIAGSGNILGGEGLIHTEWTARSDNDFTVATVAVPEPGTLALLGVALAGLTATSRRKKSSK